jgi:hypothetical protein
MKRNNFVKYLHLRTQYAMQHNRTVPLSVCIRYYLAWCRNLQAGRSAISERIPWIVFSALKFLKATLQPRGRLFEYGLGGSTLFFLDNGWDVVSVEHDKQWFDLVQQRMPAGARWHGTLVTPTPSSRGSCSDSRFRSEQPGWEDSCFKDYVMTIAAYPDQHFDAILVDGRARTDALLIAESKVSTKGMLILDNAERNRYADASKDLVRRGWRETRFSGPGPFVDHEFWDTVVFSRHSV